MTVVECELPVASLLDRHRVETAWFRDSWRAPLSEPPPGIIDIFFGIFGHHPAWMKAMLIARNRVATACGLDAPAASEIRNVERQTRYAVGDTIGVWPIFALSDTELVAGRDNRHLDFRLSVLTAADGQQPNVTVSTVCSVHNLAGKLYLLFIVPFHRWGVRHLLANAVSAGRL